jgi:TolA-binding protein
VKRTLVTVLSGVLFCLSAATQVGCTANHPKKHFVLAEKFWADGQYQSAVTEFDKVTQKDPKGKLGAQALFRSAHTEFLFLGKYTEAIRKLNSYSEHPQADPTLAWEAQKQMGEIYFVKSEQYEKAIQHYQALLRLKPSPEEAAEFAFRVAKSQFFLWQFDEAIQSYTQLRTTYPKTIWAEQARIEMAQTHYTRGDQKTGLRGGTVSGNPYQDAMASYDAYLKEYPQGKWVAEAKFGIASCLEELDRLDDAYRAYEAIKSEYPSKKVILIKLARIQERLHQKRR